MSGTGTPSAFSLLRNRRYAAVLAYRICALLSYQIVAVTVGWHIYELTRDTFSLGLVGLADSAGTGCDRKRSVLHDDRVR